MTILSTSSMYKNIWLELCNSSLKLYWMFLPLSRSFAASVYFRAPVWDRGGRCSSTPRFLVRFLVRYLHLTTFLSCLLVICSCDALIWITLAPVVSMCPRYAPISETCLKHVPIITSFNNVRLSYTFSKTFRMREYMYMSVDNRPMKGM